MRNNLFQDSGHPATEGNNPWEMENEQREAANATLLASVWGLKSWGWESERLVRVCMRRISKTQGQGKKHLERSAAKSSGAEAGQEWAYKLRGIDFCLRGRGKVSYRLNLVLVFPVKTWVFYKHSKAESNWSQALYLNFSTSLKNISRNRNTVSSTQIIKFTILFSYEKLPSTQSSGKTQGEKISTRKWLQTATNDIIISHLPKGSNYNYILYVKEDKH